MGATCIVATSQRCDAPTDGEHSRVRFRAGRWERWHYIGLWVTTSREPQRPAKVRPPSLAELAASVPRRERPAALARIGYPVETVWRQP